MLKKIKIKTIKYIFSFAYKGRDLIIANVKLHSGVINEISIYSRTVYPRLRHACEYLIKISIKRLQ